jgi:hypothetical protein
MTVIATPENLGDTIELSMSLMFVFITCFCGMACLNIKLTVYLKTTNRGTELKMNPRVNKECNYSVIFQKHSKRPFSLFLILASIHYSLTIS